MIAPQRAGKIIDAFPRASVLVIGDLMMDRFLWGGVSRISPEAPVPVVEVSNEEDRPGGAGNVIFNLTSLEAKVFAGGIVGMDAVGERLVRDFEYRGVSVEGVLLDPARPTSLKTRVIAGHQHVVRFDKESKVPISHDFEKRLLDVLASIISRVEAVIVSDYGKGLVTPRLTGWLVEQCQRRGIGIFVDPKPENMRLYRNVTCLTPNTGEAFVGMGLLPRTDDASVETVGKKIIRTLNVRQVLITRGSQGMTLLTSGGAKRRAPTPFAKFRGPAAMASGHISALGALRSRAVPQWGTPNQPAIRHIATVAREVYDVTGAGDTAVACFALCQTAGASPVEAAELSNLAAGIVVGKVGTATVARAELREALK